MNEPLPPEQLIAGVASELRAKLGVGGKDLAGALSKARHRLPRRIYRLGLSLVAAAPLAGHPKLRLTLDQAALASAAQEISDHLAGIDLAEQRKDWWLGALGALSFNLILMAVLFVAFLRWRGVF